LAWPLPALAEPPSSPFGISELKLGALYHDTPGLWAGASVERPAADANLEVLFAPWSQAFGGYLRPALGATINFNGETSKAYADLRWEIEAPSGLFFALGMGAAVHNGDTDISDPDRKALGFPVLFHPSAEIGYRWDGVNSLSIFADHMSNGFTQRFNEGMDTVGIRYGRRLVPIATEAPPNLPSSDFSGFYVGAFAAYEHETTDWFTASPVRSERNSAGWGGYAGYNWQSGKGLFGLEVAASPAKRSFDTGCETGVDCRIEINGVYSVGARFGWVIQNVLIYGSGGVALAPWDASVIDLGTAARLDHVSGVNYGVAVAAGVEYKPMQNFGLRAELAHYGIDGWALDLPSAGATSNQFQGYVARAGVTWYFH
jgi:opacity protein-like surface antigen